MEQIDLIILERPVDNPLGLLQTRAELLTDVRQHIGYIHTIEQDAEHGVAMIMLSVPLNKLTAVQGKPVDLPDYDEAGTKWSAARTAGLDALTGEAQQDAAGAAEMPAAADDDDFEYNDNCHCFRCAGGVGPHIEPGDCDSGE